jgi:hypothetical protein
MSRVIIAIMLTGCSWAFTTSPEPNKPCEGSEASPIADAAIAVSFGVATIFAAQEAAMPYGDDDAIGVAVVTGVIAGLYGASGITGFDRIGKCRRHEKQLYEDSLRRQTAAAAPVIQRRDAWQLTKQAQVAARAGDCATVYTIDEVLRGVDAEFHRTVFARDHAIIQCIAAREIPIEAPGTTPPAATAAPTPAPP